MLCGAASTAGSWHFGEASYGRSACYGTCARQGTWEPAVPWLQMHSHGVYRGATAACPACLWSAVGFAYDTKAVVRIKSFTTFARLNVEAVLPWWDVVGISTMYACTTTWTTGPLRHAAAHPRFPPSNQQNRRPYRYVCCRSVSCFHANATMCSRVWECAVHYQPYSVTLYSCLRRLATCDAQHPPTPVTLLRDVPSPPINLAMLSTLLPSRHPQR